MQRFKLLVIVGYYEDQIRIYVNKKLYKPKKGTKTKLKASN